VGVEEPEADAEEDVQVARAVCDDRPPADAGAAAAAETGVPPSAALALRVCAAVGGLVAAPEMRAMRSAS
jgi:hypothetical protein